MEQPHRSEQPATAPAEWEPGIAIAEAAPEDSMEISRIIKDGWLTTYPNEELAITAEDILSKDFDSPERVALRAERIRTQEDAKVWVARESGKVIGICIADRKDQKNELSGLYISSDHRGKGIGKRLMDQAVGWLGREKDIALSVVSYNQNAISFYERYGFQKIGPVVNGGPHFPTGRSLPEIEMLLPSEEG